MANKPIFFDETGRRAARLSILGWVGAILSTVLGIAFVASILASQRVASPQLLYKVTANNQLVRKALDPALLKSAARLAAEARAREKLALSWRTKNAHAAPARSLSAGLRPLPHRPLAIGFYVTWDDTSYPALKRALPKLDWVVASWLSLTGPDMHLQVTMDIKALTLVHEMRPAVPILPVIQNATMGTWNGPGLQTLLADPVRRAALEKGIVSFLAENKLQGVVVDFEEVPRSGYADLGTFLSELSALFAPHGWIVVQAAPYADDNWPYATFAKSVDYTMLMAYDEHDDTGPAGAIAGEPWFETNLDKRMKELSPSRTIIGLGNYAYDWHGEETADDISFQDAAVAARDSEARVDFDPNTNNPHFSYIENDNVKHDVWFLDGVTAYNQIHAADVYQPAGYALWRLGSEDPSVWSVLGRPYGANAPATLKEIPTNQDVDFEGDGEILRVEADPASGSRTIEIDPQTGDINDETYTKLPTTYIIRRVGLEPHTLALTFDDGPDPQWTPAILDILKKKNVKATFFIIGANAEAHPGLVQRILDDGNEIGNHTFTHPNLAETSDAADAVELNATQRLFEALTGRSMRLFRPPYLGDAEPVTEDEIVPVEIAQNLGYITIGVHVDPLDWEQPTAQEMMQRVLKAVNDPNPELRGNIILLHDSGGDRSGTVAVLSELIDQLRARGYHFELVSQLAGLTREQAMPRLEPTAMLYADRLVFLTVSWVGSVLYYCFLAAIFLGIGRLLLLCGLSLWNRGREMGDAAPPAMDADIPVSVIIPAFNEEKVIASTVTRILNSDHRNLQIIVVDDGSHDKTADVVRERFGGEAKVTLVSVPNGGKAKALNFGFASATGDVVVALDADTEFDHDTISRLVRWFVDPKVGAVAGNAKVGNRINMITRWQALEYIVAQNLERRALAALGTLTVVPGAVGAWRRAALAEIGGFPVDTLAEDQDLTIALQRAGYKVHFDSSAVAWTEAPATVRGLAKQRFRWAYGTLQCLWKYHAMTFNPRYGALGLVALPQVWLFQILLTALAPIADLLLVWQLLTQWLAYTQHGAEFSNDNLYTVGIYYCVFMVVDLAAAVFGFLMEKRENWSLLWWLMLQRFGYRQLMYYVVVRSISTALRGAFVSWGKLERTGSVKLRRA
ncbi:MAG: glycosyltransferase [Rhizomicrobium sp.]|jgi:cellulose synthase/poly-beta-1,6-N-acetylglucosamine synthase-like glycosyltransferase/peptidoglycan/xylan/chitin deacetylase (PgdA/CDA1 family)